MLTSVDLKNFMGVTSADVSLNTVVDWAVDATNDLILQRCAPYLNDTDEWPRHC